MNTSLELLHLLNLTFITWTISLKLLTWSSPLAPLFFNYFLEILHWNHFTSTTSLQLLHLLYYFTWTKLFCLNYLTSTSSLQLHYLNYISWSIPLSKPFNWTPLIDVFHLNYCVLRSLNLYRYFLKLTLAKMKMMLNCIDILMWNFLTFSRYTKGKFQLSLKEPSCLLSFLLGPLTKGVIDLRT